MRKTSILIAIVILFSLVACGSATSVSEPDPAEGSNWNEMIWDQDEWA